MRLSCAQIPRFPRGDDICLVRRPLAIFILEQRGTSKRGGPQQKSWRRNYGPLIVAGARLTLNPEAKDGNSSKPEP
jgi:hypothetical protein